MKTDNEAVPGGSEAREHKSPADQKAKAEFYHAVFDALRTVLIRPNKPPGVLHAS